MYSIIISLPLTTSITLLIFGRNIGIKGSKIITILNMLIINIIGIWYIKEAITKKTIKLISLGRWLEIGTIVEKYKIEISKITIIMTTLIIIISFCIIIYSFWYLEIDAHINRFISYLLLFTTSMLILVNSSNIIIIIFRMGISRYN